MPRAIANPTPEQLARRQVSTAAARRSRAKALAARNQGATACQRRVSSTTVCGGVLEDRVDRRTGTVTTACPRCERREAGICQDCPRPVVGRRGQALRCAACKRARSRETSRLFVQRNRELVSERWSARWRAMDPEQRRRKLEEKRQWRRANPDRIKAYRERERVARADQIKAYHARRREQKRQELREKARAYYYAHRPAPTVRPCRSCGAAIQWAPPGRPKVRCDDCVPPSVRARRRQVVPAYERPVTVAPARRCLTRGCQSVVSGRAKKCFTCRQKHQQTARMLLAARRAA